MIARFMHHDPRTFWTRTSDFGTLGYHHIIGGGIAGSSEPAPRGARTRCREPRDAPVRQTLAHTRTGSRARVLEHVQARRPNAPGCSG